MASAKIPIKNYVYGAPVGDYVACIELGSDKVQAWVILDTGSSTLAVWQDMFEEVQTEPTDFVQFVGYGTGHWAGPVLIAQVGMGTGEHYIGLSKSGISQIQSGIYQGQRQFHPADGILGLAYYQLNNAAKVPSVSFPLSQYDSAQKWYQLTNPQSPNHLPVEYLPPFMAELVDAGATPNKFAFLTRRSIAHNGSDPATDPLNQGWFILGGGEEHKELYTGDFQEIKEIDDPNGVGRYYNTNLLGVQVGDGQPIQVEPPSQEYLLSNSIIDSGTNSIALTQDLFEQVIKSIGNLPRPNSQADLANWPPIYFILEGSDGSEVGIEVTPENYWQLDSIAPGRTSATVTGNMFNISPTGGGQSILGLPVMNNHYVVFDRSSQNPPVAGVIKFAAANPDGFPS